MVRQCLPPREGVADEFALDASGREVDGDDVDTGEDGAAVLAGEGAEVGASHVCEHVALGGVDGEGGWGLIADRARLDLDEAEGVALPGDEVEVAAEVGAAPAVGDDEVALAAEEEEGFEFPALADLEVRGLFAVAGEAEGERLKPQQGG